VRLYAEEEKNKRGDLRWKRAENEEDSGRVLSRGCFQRKKSNSLIC
jgi:hypothetical protein